MNGRRRCCNGMREQGVSGFFEYGEGENDIVHMAMFGASGRFEIALWWSALATAEFTRPGLEVHFKCVSKCPYWGYIFASLGYNADQDTVQQHISTPPITNEALNSIIPFYFDAVLASLSHGMCTM